MTGHVAAIETRALKNTHFRQVLFTGKHSHLVLMCLQPGEEIGDARLRSGRDGGIRMRPASGRAGFRDVKSA